MVDQRFLNDFKREHVNSMSKFDWGKQIKLADNWTSETRRAICMICLWLVDNGYSFGTEVKMAFGLRADIVVPELYGSEIIEVYDSEGTASLGAKRNIYEEHGLEMLAVPADPEQAIALIKAANGL